MVKMQDSSKAFLKKNAPAVLEKNTSRDALIELGKFINHFGFSPPEYEDYNDLGREAQKVYDDIYLSNEY